MMRKLIILLMFFSAFVWNACKNDKKGMLKNEVVEKAEDVVFGSPFSETTVFMYASYNCTYCRLFFSETLPGLQEKYLRPGKLKLVVKFFDFGDNPQVLKSLQAASCINRFGDFEKFHPLLLVSPDVVFTEDFDHLLDDIMEDNAEIAECILHNNNYDYVRSNLRDFKANGFTGTPTFVFGQKAYRGFLSFDEFEKRLKREFNF